MESSTHNIEINDLLASLVSDPASYRTHGMSVKDSTVNKEKYGTNNFTMKKKELFIFKFVRLYVQPFNLLLLVASILSFIVYFSIKEVSSLFLAFGIIMVSIMNTFIEFYQEYTTSAILEGFKSLVPNTSLVTREGNSVHIKSNEILVGDLVHLKAGEKIPADIRLITALFLKVDNSSLTGESTPLKRMINNFEKEYINAENMLFAGNIVVSGEGSGIVVGVGDGTMLGKIAQLAVSHPDIESELSVEINDYVKKLGLFALFVSVLFYAIAMINGFTMTDNLSFCIGVFIAFVPQGLPAAVTILLCIAAKRMAKRNVLVKDLRAVETLGSISLLATDKTGTITQGKMTCTLIWDGKNLVEDKNEWKKYKRIGEIGKVTSRVQIVENTNRDYFEDTACDVITVSKNNLEFSSPEKVLYSTPDSVASSNNTNQGSVISSVLTLNNTKGISSEEVHFKYNPKREKPKKHLKVTGDPTELAIYEFSIKIFTMKSDEKVLYEVPFDSERKFQLCIVDSRYGYKAYLKGAPEKIIKFCSDFVGKKIDDNFLHLFKDTYYVLASQGHRVIAFAEKSLDPSTVKMLSLNIDAPVLNSISSDTPNVEEVLDIVDLRGFNFHGMIGIVDPPKEGVREAVMKLRLAGIRVMMITGDHPLTAEYIAKKTSILSKSPSDDTMIIGGDEISKLTDYDWAIINGKRELVFARTTPSQKLLIVEKLQSFGHIVGVCGDGVNDSLALKRANLGISMNKTGSEASKEAASMILLDDDFTSIVDGVLEGRLVFVNLKKCIRYILSHITPQVIPFLLFVAIGVPSPMSSLLLMFIDLFTEFFPSILLAWEQPEGNLMIEAPRKIGNRKEKTLFPSIKIRPELSHNVTYEEKQFNSTDENQSELIEITDESLCDLDVLSWAYLEAGLITTIGALSTFFVVLSYEGIPIKYFVMSAQHFFKKNSMDIILPDRVITAQEQINILSKAQSAYFLSILIGQTFNLIACKRKYETISRNSFKNMLPIIGSFFGFFFGLFITMSPFMNKILLSKPVNLSHLLIALVICSLIIIWDFFRKKMKRNLIFGKLKDTDALYRIKRSRMVSERR